MSDDVLSIIPADPQWQPDRTDAGRTTAIIVTMIAEDSDAAEVKVQWHDQVTLVDCGGNLQHIGCPICHASIDTQWWAELVGRRYEDGSSDLGISVPCCGSRTTLDTLIYEWPCGFARFEIAIWNPGRGWFTDEELAALQAALGYPVRQIMAHI